MESVCAFGAPHGAGSLRTSGLVWVALAWLASYVSEAVVAPVWLARGLTVCTIWLVSAYDDGGYVPARVMVRTEPMRCAREPWLPADAALCARVVVLVGWPAGLWHVDRARVRERYRNQRRYVHYDCGIACAAQYVRWAAG